MDCDYCHSWISADWSGICLIEAAVHIIGKSTKLCGSSIWNIWIRCRDLFVATLISGKRWFGILTGMNYIEEGTLYRKVQTANRIQASSRYLISNQRIHEIVSSLAWLTSLFSRSSSNMSSVFKGLFQDLNLFSPLVLRNMSMYSAPTRFLLERYFVRTS